MGSIRVLVADDHPLIAQGLVGALRSFDIEIVEGVTDGEVVVQRFIELAPDVLVLDLRIGPVRGLEIARALLAKRRQARIVVYSQFDQNHIVREAYRCGVKAFVPKSAEVTALADAIVAAHTGAESYLPEIAERLARMSVHGDDSPQSKLSDRELVVFKKLAQGLTNTEIAQELGLSTKTIGLITQAVREALGITRAADLTRLALRHQLIEE
jgi:two-component system, NarL family, invasion response regulator UvrY